MNLKDCKFATVPVLPATRLLDSEREFEPVELPARARIVAIVHDSAETVLLAYTVTAQGLPQEDIDRAVRLAVRKGMYLTEREAVGGLTERALHDYGTAKLSDLSPEQYAELVKWLRFVEVQTGAASNPGESR